MAKEEYIKMFNDTLSELQEEKYHDDLLKSINDSKLYKKAPELKTKGKLPDSIIFDVVSTLQCAKSLDNACVLNFASAISVGGGVKYGANAQEESICRASSLYYALIKHTEYYENNNDNQPLYLDWTIYTPGVIVIKGQLLLD